jgi:hypothetical protein
MSIRGTFIASLIALVFGIAWIGEASAQSSLPPCPPVGYVWDRSLAPIHGPTAASTSATGEMASRMATMGDFDDASGEIFEKAFAV